MDQTPGPSGADLRWRQRDALAVSDTSRSHKLVPGTGTHYCFLIHNRFVSPRRAQDKRSIAQPVPGHRHCRGHSPGCADSFDHITLSQAVATRLRTRLGRPVWLSQDYGRRPAAVELGRHLTVILLATAPAIAKEQYIWPNRCGNLEESQQS